MVSCRSFFKILQLICRLFFWMYRSQVYLADLGSRSTLVQIQPSRRGEVVL